MIEFRMASRSDYLYAKLDTASPPSASKVFGISKRRLRRWAMSDFNETLRHAHFMAYMGSTISKEIKRKSRTKGFMRRLLEAKQRGLAC